MGEPIVDVPPGTRVRDIPAHAGLIVEHTLRCLWTVAANPQADPQRHEESGAIINRLARDFNRVHHRFQQGYASSLSQGGTVTVAAMESTTPNALRDQVAMRLRCVGKLADRLDAGADPEYVVDVAKAMVDSCVSFVARDDEVEEAG